MLFTIACLSGGFLLSWCFGKPAVARVETKAKEKGGTRTEDTRGKVAAEGERVEVRGRTHRSSKVQAPETRLARLLW